MGNQAQYIQHLHAFRGFAIINIVGAHAWSFMIFWTGGLDSIGLKWLFAITETFFHDSTLYFAIISGLLFTKVLEGRGWRAFFHSKLFNVLLPYMVMTIVLTWAWWDYAVESAKRDGIEINFVTSLLMNLVNGKASIHFWYIPVLMVMFALTPLLLYIQRKTPWVTWVLMLTPLAISRSPFPDFIQPQSFAYFIGAYALGMFVGSHYDSFQKCVARYRHLLLSLVALTTITLVALYLWNYQKTSFYSIQQTLFYAQKIAICGLVLYWFASNEKNIPGWLMLLGSYAFAIYFVHVVFIAYLIQFVSRWLEDARPVELISLFGLANLLVGIIGSILLTKILQKILGRHSRKLVGA